MTTFVFIPGAGGDGWDFHLIVPILRARGHEAIAVDLPAGDPNAGWTEYADAVVGAVGRARSEAVPVTVVALSMGGFTAPLVVGRLSVERIVMLNAMIPVPGETGGQWWKAVGQRDAMAEQARREGRDPDAEFDVVDGFFHDVPAAVTEEAFARGEPQQSDRPFEDPWPLTAWPEVPTSAIAGRDDRLFPAEFQRRVARERLGIETTVIPGGHLVALSNPDGLVTALLELAG
jgi:pimeloyl-ACP methyl ester carboxylesterase